MTTHANTEAIRWALARWLPGMREECHFCRGKGHAGGRVCSFCGVGRTAYDGKNAGRGWVPVPLDGEEISVGKLIRAIEAERGVMYHKRRWLVDLVARPDLAPNEMSTVASDPDLAVAFLKARGDRPLSAPADSVGTEKENG